MSVFLNTKPTAKRITKAWSKTKRQKALLTPSPVTILKGDSIVEVAYTQSGKPTAESQRALDALYKGA